MKLGQIENYSASIDWDIFYESSRKQSVLFNARRTTHRQKLCIIKMKTIHTRTYTYTCIEDSILSHVMDVWCQNDIENVIPEYIIQLLDVVIGK